MYRSQNKIRGFERFDNFTGDGTEAVWQSLQGTPDQMGIPFAQIVFNNQNLTPGAAAALAANPPFRFYTNGQQFLLPPPNMVVGGVVPPLPDNIQILWAPSFMGVTIPSDMIGPASLAGHLTISPLEIQSAGGTGAATNAKLVANGKVLLNLLMSVMGNLINSYSSRPYTNPKVNSGWDVISHYILDLRNKADFLSPQPEPGTLLQQAVSSVGPIFAKIAGTAANAVAPGTGATVTNAQDSIVHLIGGSSSVGPNVVNKNLTTSLVPGAVSGPGSLPIWVILLGLVAVVVIIVISLKHTK